MAVADTESQRKGNLSPVESNRKIRWAIIFKEEQEKLQAEKQRLKEFQQQLVAKEEKLRLMTE